MPSPSVAYVSLTIANTASLSNSINAAALALLQGELGTGEIAGMIPVAIYIPATLAGSVITFQQSYDSSDTNLANLYYDNSGANTEYSVAFAVSQAIALDPTKFIGGRNWKVRTGTNGSPSAQNAARTIVVALRLF